MPWKPRITITVTFPLCLQDEIFSHANGLIVKLRSQVEQITSEKDDEIRRLKEEVKRTSLSPLCNNSTMNLSVHLTQPFGFPVNEISFNDTIEKNRSAMKRIHFLKQKLR